MAKSKGTVGSASRGSAAPTFNSGGSGGSSTSQRPIPGPTNPGPPPSLRKALAKKSPRGKGI